MNPIAKHIVKCKYCGEPFDTNEVEYVKVSNGRRYAHKTCHEEYENSKSQEEKDKEALVAYIKKLLNIESLNARINKQLKDYIDPKGEYRYTYSGIHKSLVYFYEIKGNDPAKANGAIGIVPYVYRQAYEYYYDLWLKQQQNMDKGIENYSHEIWEVRIPVPRRELPKHNFFSFLDEEEEV